MAQMGHEPTRGPGSHARGTGDCLALSWLPLSPQRPALGFSDPSAALGADPARPPVPPRLLGPGALWPRPRIGGPDGAVGRLGQRRHAQRQL